MEKENRTVGLIFTTILYIRHNNDVGTYKSSLEMYSVENVGRTSSAKNFCRQHNVIYVRVLCLKNFFYNILLIFCAQTAGVNRSFRQ